MMLQYCQNMGTLSQLNIYFGISEPLNSQIIKASEDSRLKYSANWVLGNGISVPHYSLYLTAIPISNIQNVKVASDHLTKNFKRLEVKVEDIFIGRNNFVLLSFQKNEEIYKYHQMVLETFNTLREGALRKKYLNNDYISTLSDEQKELLNKYGSYYVLENFEPHITLTIAPDQDTAAKIVNKYKPLFIGKTAYLDSFQIMEDDYETNDAIRLVYNKSL